MKLLARSLTSSFYRVDVNDCSNDDDHVKNYALCFIFLAFLVMQMKDTAAEGDDNRNLIN